MLEDDSGAVGGDSLPQSVGVGVDKDTPPVHIGGNDTFQNRGEMTRIYDKDNGGSLCWLSRNL